MNTPTIMENTISTSTSKDKRYTRADFERAARSSQYHIVFKSIEAETPRNFVTRAVGTYQVGNIPVKATWNRRGECRAMTGRRAAQYDLYFDEP